MSSHIAVGPRPINSISRPLLFGLLAMLSMPGLSMGQGKKPTGPLAPTRVHLKFTDTPVDQAVAELSRQSGYFIFLGDEEGKGELKKRKITLDTGDVPFWEAFETLCAKGGLVEGSGVSLKPGAMPKLPPPPKPGEPIPLIKFGDGGPLFHRLPGVLSLKDGTRKKDPFGLWKTVPLPPARPSYTATAVRVQESKLYTSFIRDNAPLAASQVRSELRVTPEPRLTWQELVGVRVDRAVDEHGQVLQAAKNVVVPKFGSFGGGPPGGFGGGFGNPLQNDNAAFVPVRLGKGAKPSKMLKEIKGSIAAKVSVPGAELLVVNDLAKAEGKLIKGAKGGSIKVGAAKADAQGDVQFTLDLNLPGQFVPATPFGAPNTASPLPGLRVLDAAGKAIPVISMVRANPNFAPGSKPGGPTQYVVKVRPAQGQTPTRISYAPLQIVVVEIPFDLKEVAVR